LYELYAPGADWRSHEFTEDLGNANMPRPDGICMGIDLEKKTASTRFVPATTLAHMVGETVRAVEAQEILGKGRILVIGIPGAYTPICTTQHVPNLVDNAEALASKGFDRLVCIAPNDPFVLDRWAQELAPNGEVQFYSDGNLDFFKALSMTTKVESLFLGERCKRFMMIVENGRIVHFRVERDVTHFTCTGATEALQMIAPQTKHEDSPLFKGRK
jgi:peroxiredoxin